jgi:hypothetical protein
METPDWSEDSLIQFIQPFRNYQRSCNSNDDTKSGHIKNGIEQEMKSSSAEAEEVETCHCFFIDSYLETYNFRNFSVTHKHSWKVSKTTFVLQPCIN